MAPSPDMLPVWSPDGNRLAYVSGNPPGRPGQSVSPSPRPTAAASLSPSLPWRAEPYCEPTDWLSDDRLSSTSSTRPGGDVWIVSTERQLREPLLAEPYTERDARSFARRPLDRLCVRGTRTTGGVGAKPLRPARDASRLRRWRGPAGLASRWERALLRRSRGRLRSVSGALDVGRRRRRSDCRSSFRYRRSDSGIGELNTTSLPMAAASIS